MEAGEGCIKFGQGWGEKGTGKIPTVPTLSEGGRWRSA